MKTHDGGIPRLSQGAAADDETDLPLPTVANWVSPEGARAWLYDANKFERQLRRNIAEVERIAGNGAADSGRPTRWGIWILPVAGWTVWWDGQWLHPDNNNEPYEFESPMLAQGFLAPNIWALGCFQVRRILGLQDHPLAAGPPADAAQTSWPTTYRTSGRQPDGVGLGVGCSAPQRVHEDCGTISGATDAPAERTEGDALRLRQRDPERGPTLHSLRGGDMAGGEGAMVAEAPPLAGEVAGPHIAGLSTFEAASDWAAVIGGGR